jgi:hypothetical protein
VCAAAAISELISAFALVVAGKYLLQRGRFMPERTWWETIKVEGGDLLDRVKKIIHEGNVRRIVIKQGSRSVAEFPLTVGVVGAVLAPVLAAVGAIAALLGECSIEVERVETSNQPKP